MQVRFDVKTHPQFTVEQLAVQLAESLQGSFDAQKEVQTFSAQVDTEKRKIFQLEDILLKVREFKKAPPGKISRMDPLATYQAQDIESDINTAKERLSDWNKRSVEASEKAVDLQKTANRLQLEIGKRNAQNT